MSETNLQQASEILERLQYKALASLTQSADSLCATLDRVMKAEIDDVNKLVEMMRAHLRNVSPLIDKCEAAQDPPAEEAMQSALREREEIGDKIAKLQAATDKPGPEELALRAKYLIASSRAAKLRDVYLEKDFRSHLAGPLITSNGIDDCEDEIEQARRKR